MMMAAAIQAPGLEGGPLGLPVLLWGAPGVGKTSRINKVATKLGFYNKDLTVLASVREPQDFLGLPIPGGAQIEVKEGGSQGKKMIEALEFAPPIWAVCATNHADDTGTPSTYNKATGKWVNNRKSLVFFDEFTTAGERVMSAMLRVIHERVVGEFTLNRNVVVLAAANPPAMTPGGAEDLAPPVANRFIHLYWTPPTAKQWADWLTQGLPSATGAVTAELNEDPNYLTFDLDKFNVQLTELKLHFAAWVQTKQGKHYLFDMPGPEREDIKEWFDAHPRASVAPQGQVSDLTYDARFTDIYAWSSPRTLEMACRARAAVRALNGVPRIKRLNLENEIVCGTIGTKACMSVNDFIRDEGRRLVEPSPFITEKRVREQFFSGNPNDSTQALQLERVIEFWRDLASETAEPMLPNLKPAILSFSGHEVDANFTPIRAALFSEAWQPLRDWAHSATGKELMNENPEKREQIKALFKAANELNSALQAL
jgi:hypothetical protein